MCAKVLVIGSGGREHALCWKISQSSEVKEIFVAPGNAGIANTDKVKLIDINVKNYKVLCEWCTSNAVSLVVVGPEDPLADGVGDALRAAGVPCFGPDRLAARVEADKSWAKAFMTRHGVPTARWQAFSDASRAKEFVCSADFPALVVKASGLAAGKGVVVAATRQEACDAIDAILGDRRFGDAGSVVVIEELLVGEEVSVLAFCDGTTVRTMLPSQDHKRLHNGDSGPNTGGMGAYCPCPLVSSQELHTICKSVLQKTVDGLRAEGTPFVGVLYAGLMLTSDGPKVLEFNCRFGDPETQVILPLLQSDLYAVMMACCSGQLNKVDLEWKSDTFAVGVVMASKGYPESSTKGNVITGLESVSYRVGCTVFHSGTAIAAEGGVVTAGGRVLLAVAWAPELALAAARATGLCRHTVRFDGAHYRTDVAHRGIARSLLLKGPLTYKESGVNIDAGDSLVNNIKLTAASTNRSGIKGTIGGFGGIFDVSAAGYKDPLLVAGTDGVGTKLKVAQLSSSHGTVGQDLVAMCVNDVLAQGAEPLFFLDYFATGRLDVGVATEVVAGVAEGCRLANCALIGGETAEMPGMYAPGDYDLAGFCVGAVERGALLPRSACLAPGDAVIGVASSGVHSNGFSLVRKVLDKCGAELSQTAPFSESGKTFAEEFLTPTKIYVRALLGALRSGKVKAVAHITGGGLVENLPRVLPAGIGARLDAFRWHIPPMFGWLAAVGGIGEAELLRTFNCGVGIILITSPENEQDMMKLITEGEARKIGTIEKLSSEGSPRVCVDNFTSAMESVMRPFIASVVAALDPPRKRVGVLISGSGTNLQSLIDATSDLSQGIGAEIVLVISNKKDVQGLQRAEKANIPTKVIEHKSYGSRSDFDAALHAALCAAGVELVCLAGFMRVLTGEFVRKWRGRLINIHPALLPLFKGTHAHRQALAAGVLVTGCTAHFVEEDVDAGAILAQEAVPIELGDTEETLQERVKLAEHRVFPSALRLVATGRVRLGLDGELVWRTGH